MIMQMKANSNSFFKLTNNIEGLDSQHLNNIFYYYNTLKE